MLSSIWSLQVAQTLMSVFPLALPGCPSNPHLPSVLRSSGRQAPETTSHGPLSAALWLERPQTRAAWTAMSSRFSEIAHFVSPVLPTPHIQINLSPSYLAINLLPRGSVFKIFAEFSHFFPPDTRHHLLSLDELHPNWSSCTYASPCVYSQPTSPVFLLKLSQTVMLFCSENLWWLPSHST